MESTSAIMYPIISESALMMNIEAFEKTSLSQGCLDRPTVRAAGFLRRDSSTEIIDLNKLAQKSTSVIQYVSIKNIYIYISSLKIIFFKLKRNLKEKNFLDR